MMQGQEFNMEIAVVQLQADVEVLQGENVTYKGDLARLERFITGNGEPSKGLLWLVTDLGRMVGQQTDLLTAHVKAFRHHVEEQHAPVARERPWYLGVAIDVTKQVAVAVTTVILVLLFLGLESWVRVTAK